MLSSTREKKSHVRNLFFILAIAAVTVCVSAGSARELVLPDSKDISLQKEVDRTVRMGFEYLQKSQNPDGSWSSPDYPALTGLVLYAFLTSPEYKNMTERPLFIQKGLDFILQNVKPDGSIVKETLPNYNTAICAMALAAANDPRYYSIIRKARRYLVSLQMDEGEPESVDYVYDGGIGYGSKDHSDMSNTFMAIEALRLTEFVESEMNTDAGKDLQETGNNDLNWAAALKFIERCQNLTAYNDQEWASDDAGNRGGFVYYPGESKAGEETLANGKTALRSYGSMTYAGMMSLIYTDLKKDDPRVTAAYDWIKGNYTLDENPGMGQQGLYYYYHVMAKALTAVGDDRLQTSDGQNIDWRKNLTLKLVQNQKGEGYWVNDNARWFENDPVLVTSYALIALNLVAN